LEADENLEKKKRDIGGLEREKRNVIPSGSLPS
jgi:hypothetical protein